jgi:hypothetical protein
MLKSSGTKVWQVNSFLRRLNRGFLLQIFAMEVVSSTVSAVSMYINGDFFERGLLLLEDVLVEDEAEE